MRIHVQSEDISKNNGGGLNSIKPDLNSGFKTSQEFRGNLDRFRPIDVLYEDG